MVNGEGLRVKEPLLTSAMVQSKRNCEWGWNGLSESSKVGTLHFIGKFVGVPLQILVDGGSSDNFLQPCIAKFLQLIESTPGFKVLMGNGQSMVAEGKISDLTIEVQRHLLQLPTFLLPFSRGRFDFGFFLVGHSGSHIADYATLSLKFFANGKSITLSGVDPSLPASAQLHHIQRLHRSNSIAEIFTMQVLHIDYGHIIPLELPQNLPPELASLLQQYGQVFQTPVGLPPPCL
ncbi:hypothetical protein KIW84_025197 [Lathyrus oleraceus]|uniref:Uncharacterized protein n=1 Tax=Pisum sativum TaxID=3888 RepID=A0A9D4YJT0_PEA|nr:hypothetical protein KIW84_025197 [Pisum sativum]